MNTKTEQFPAKNPNPVISVEKDGVVLYSNEAGEPLLHEWDVEIGGKLPSTFGNLVQRVISRNIPENMEVRVEKRVYMIAFHPLPEQECVNIYGFDISDQKEIEKKLRESEGDLAEVQKLAHIGNWKWNIVTNELHWSDEVYRIFGLKPQEFSLTFDAYFNYVHPDNRDCLNNAIKKAFEGEPYSIDNRIITANGEERIIHTDAEFTFNENNIPVYARGIVQDITERKEAEEALKKAHDSLEEKVKERTKELEEAYNSLKESERGFAEAQKMAHIGNWEWDSKADKAYWSEEMYRIFGRDPKKSAPHYNEYLSYIHPDDRDYFENLARKAVSGRPYNIEYRIVQDNGEERIVQMQAYVIFGEKNTPIRVKGIVQDITDSKKAEKALVNLEIARKKEIHHRIKNNLQVISSLLDLQAENLSNRKCIKDSDVLNAFRESQDRVMSIALIHEELHEGGENNTLYFSPYLEKLVKNLLRTYNLGNADISLKIDLEENIFFDMDTAVPLGIIVNELVSNSLKHAFSGRDKGEIQIKLFKEEAGNEMNNDEEEFTGKGTGYTLIVSDDGVGIPEKMDLENSDTLGLQLVNILVDQLDGEIKLKRDEGTEFNIRINV